MITDKDIAYYESRAVILHNIDLEVIYRDIDDYYKEEGLKFTRKDKLLFLLSLDGCSKQKAARITGFYIKRRLTEYCSRRLFKCLKKMLDITEDESISWQSIKTIIENDAILNNGGYLMQPDPIKHFNKFEVTEKVINSNTKGNITIDGENFNKEELHELICQFKQLYP